MKVTVDYFTDPLCAWSYASEPTVEKILSTFGGKVDFRFRTLPIIDRIEGEKTPGLKVYTPDELSVAWQEIARKTGTQIDVGLWQQNPPHSSWPANRALKASLRQGIENGRKFIHNLRDAIMRERKNPSDLEVLKAVAGQSGLDVERFQEDMTMNATQLEQEIVDDRLAATEMCVTATPAFVMTNDDGYMIIIQGQLDFDVIRPAIMSLMGEKASETTVGEPAASM